MTFMQILAQATTAPVTDTPAAQPQSNPMSMVVMFVIFIGIFYFIALRPRQKEQKKRDQMLKAIKKYDKVMTIGGIIGTVMEVREEEIIIKVDDNSNTRIKFTRSAVQRVLSVADAEKSEA
jgi:preprotein translocase subunit YajC